MGANGNGGITGFLTQEAIPFVANMFLHEGSIMRLLENFIIEPTIFVSNDLKQDPDLLNRAISDQIDVFCSFYSMAFQVMNELAGSKAGVNLKSLGTKQYDYTMNLGDVARRGLRDSLSGNTGNSSFTSFTTESYNGNEHPVMHFNNSKFLSTCFENADTRVRYDMKQVGSGQLDSKKLENNSYGVHIRFFELTTKRKFQSTQSGNYIYRGSKISDNEVNEIIKEWTANNQYGYDAEKKIYYPMTSVNYKEYDRESLLEVIGIQYQSGSDAIYERDLVIPIVVRAHVLFFTQDDLDTVFDIRSEKNSFTRRYWEWRSGGISFKDLIFAGDLIKEYRENKKVKNTKIIDVIQGKGYNATLTAMFNQGKPGYEKFFNLYLLSGSDRDYIERYLNKTFDQVTFVQSLLTKLQAMELVVLDTELDTGHMYLHAMPNPSVFALSKLGKRKDKTHDLGDLLKSLYSNQPPVF